MAGSLNWKNLVTVGSAAVLVGTEVVAATFAGAWALAGLFGLGDVGTVVFEVIGVAIGLFALWAFLRAAIKVEPITR